MTMTSPFENFLQAFLFVLILIESSGSILNASERMALVDLCLLRSGWIDPGTDPCISRSGWLGIIVCDSSRTSIVEL